MWQRIAAAFKAFLRSCGFDIAFSDAELRGLLAKGMRKLKTAPVVKNNLTTDGKVRFAVEDIFVDKIPQSYFLLPDKNVQLQALPEVILIEFNKTNKPLILKKNIVEKNKSHNDLTENDILQILGDAIYNCDLIIQPNPRNKPDYFMLVSKGDKNKQALLEISEGKNQYEVVNYHYLGERQLSQKIRRAEKQNGFVKNISRDGLPDSIITTKGAAGRFSALTADRDNISRNPENASNTDGVRHSIAPEESKQYYDIPFADSVDAVMNGTYSGNGAVFMRDTPRLFVDMGFSKLPIMTTARHIESIYSAKQTRKDHNHDLGELIKQIPEKLENPLMVITSETHPDTSVVVILELTDKNGNTVVVPILLNGRSDQNKIDAHIMTSAQGRENAFSKLAKNAVDKENAGIPSVLYAQKSAEPMLNAEGVQFPNRYAFDSVNHNITDVGLNVKPQTETLQFKKWFAESKVVDENGEPLVVYHGTLAKDFTAFNKDFIGSRYSYDDRGFFFIDRESIAEDYAVSEFDSSRKGRIIAAYVSLQKPLIVDKKWCLKNGLGDVFANNDVIDFLDAYQSYVWDMVDEAKPAVPSSVSGWQFRNPDYSAF